MMILDGGLGQELVRRAGGATDLWSVKALLDNPEMVRAVHDDFFAAGAQVVTTNTYMLLPDRMEPKGLGDQLGPLTQAACDIAVASRDAHGSGLVLGSMGPQGFSYQPDKFPPVDQAAETYAATAKVHAPWVDIHALETVASLDHARAGLMGASVTGKPIWLALTVDDGDGTKLRSGEALADVAPLITEFGPQAVLVNCSLPEAADQSMPILADFGLPFGAYANGFTCIHSDFNSIYATADILEKRTDLTPQAYLAFAQGWARAGATIIGGCCEIGPAHIAALAKGL